MMGKMSEDVGRLIDSLEAILVGDVRSRIIAGLTEGGTAVDWVVSLRTQMESHRFHAGNDILDVGRDVARLDARTSNDGFRALHAWNHESQEFTNDIVPVLMIDFLQRVDAPVLQSDGGASRATVAILLDYYLLHLLALCAMRAWDTQNPTATMERLTGLVQQLQGEDGSGHRFVADAETLLIYAISQFHPEEQAYDRIIEKVDRLEGDHPVLFAHASVAVLSAHLRWGFWLMYDRDPIKMRRDNTGDYPWLLNSVLTLAREFSSSVSKGESVEERAAITQSLLQGLAADPYAFIGSPPPSLMDYVEEYAELEDVLRKHIGHLLEEFEIQKPDKNTYAPLALHFNFPHNAVVATVTLALLEGSPQPLTLNDLFVSEFDTGVNETQKSLAEKLMAFSRGTPDRLGHRGSMLVAYDPLSGLRSFSMTRDTLRRGLAT